MNELIQNGNLPPEITVNDLSEAEKALIPVIEDLQDITIAEIEVEFPQAQKGSKYPYIANITR